MAEKITPKEGFESAESAPSPETGPQPEQRPEQTAEQRQEGMSEHTGEQAGGGGAAPSATYVPQAQDEQVHEELKATPQDQQVAKLKHMALQEGALKAVFHAKKLSDPYVIDELHDALVDELRGQLFEDGNIEKM